MSKSNHKVNWFLKLEDILQVIGLVESKGKHFNLKPENRAITTHSIEDLLAHFSKNDKNDFGRTIRNTKQLFNSNVKGYQIQGDKKGTYIIKTSNAEIHPKDFAENPAYKTLLIFALAISTYKDQLEWNVLYQLFQQEHPLAFICFLIVAIEYKLLLKIQYFSDRKQQQETFEGVACKIVSREGHWLLIVYSTARKDWFHILIHSIVNIEPIQDSLKQFKTEENIPPFNSKSFYKDTFTLAKLDNQKPITYVIKVPKEKKKAITKRRESGKWENRKDYWLWTVSSYDEMEVFDYIFRWKGDLELIEPAKARENFYKILENLKSLHKQGDYELK